MKSTQIIGVVIIIAGFVLGYLGFNKVSDSSNSINIVGIEIDASSKSGKNEGYLFLGGAVLLLVGGVYTLKTSKN